MAPGYHVQNARAGRSEPSFPPLALRAPANSAELLEDVSRAVAVIAVLATDLFYRCVVASGQKNAIFAHTTPL